MTNLFIFVEGNDDKKIFDKIINPKFREKGKYVKLILYKLGKSKQFINNLLKSIKDDNSYIFITDNDQFPCITKRKTNVKETYKKLQDDNILVVVEEIESWYLAGLDKDALKKLGIKKKIQNTNRINKEQFKNLTPKRFQDSKINFINEILKHFSVETAKKKNRSFKYFFEKYLSG